MKKNKIKFTNVIRQQDERNAIGTQWASFPKVGIVAHTYRLNLSHSLSVSFG